MHYLELVSSVAKQADISKLQAKKILGIAQDTIIEQVAKGEKVSLQRGFGSFELRHRDTRTGRNPATGEPLQIPAHDTPCFKSGTLFKELVNKS